MKRPFLSSAVLLLCVAASFAVAKELPTAKPEQVGMSSAGLEKVDATMSQLMRDKKLAGAIVMVARRGKVVHFKPYGFMDLEKSKPMRCDTIMRFYSMTKAITSAAALVLYDEKKLELDDPVSKYLPDLKGLKVHADAPRTAEPE